MTDREREPNNAVSKNKTLAMPKRRINLLCPGGIPCDCTLKLISAEL